MNRLLDETIDSSSIGDLECTTSKGAVWAILLSLALFSYANSANGATFDVASYGAKGDGVTNDAPAFLKAWKDVCSNKENYPTLLIPGRKNFMLSSVEFKGPCAAPNVGVLVLGNVLSSTNKEDWKTCKDWISFADITNLVVQGSGVINGNGAKWWKDELSCGKRPTNFALNGCTNASVSGIHSKDSARNHISVAQCKGTTISHITITAPADSPNTDGIDISGSTYVTVTNSHIRSGDDCIAINNHCNNINITKIVCGPGHGISVGSLGENGEVAEVEDIYVHNCTLDGTMNGARIKTWKGGKGYARRITYSDIILKNVRRPIIIEQTYVNRYVTPDGSSVAISDVKFLNFEGTCQDKDAITLKCSELGPGCIDMEISDVTITSATGGPVEVTCQNAHGRSMRTQPFGVFVVQSGKGVVWAILLSLALFSCGSLASRPTFVGRSYGGKGDGETNEAATYGVTSYGAKDDNEVNGDSFDVTSNGEKGEDDETYGATFDVASNGEDEETNEATFDVASNGEKGEDDETYEATFDVASNGEEGEDEEINGATFDATSTNGKKEKNGGGKEGEKGDGKKGKKGDKGDDKKGKKGNSEKSDEQKGDGHKGHKEKGDGHKGQKEKGHKKKGDDGQKGGGEKGDGQKSDDGEKGDGQKGDVTPKGSTFDVTSYGAKGDGQTNDVQAFMKAWEQVCSSTENNPVLVIPKGKNFMLSAIEFKGPCKASSVSVSVLGNVVSSPNKNDWKSCTDWISFADINNLQVQGSGLIDGNGKKWWSNELNCGKRPTNLALNGCTNVALSGIQSKDSARNHLSVSNCNGATISGITLTAPDESPNTDGIDIASSKDVIVKDSHIGSGDDCIAINNNCNNIEIANIKCGPGHGISVGSLGRDGETAQVEGVYVHDCTLTGTTNGARIKTWKGGKGYARKITFENINLVNVKRPIIIDQNYVDKHHKPSNGGGSVEISDVKFTNFKGTCEDTDAITLECSAGSGCRNVELTNVKITSNTGEPTVTVSQNAHGKSTQTEPAVKLISERT
ncbi:unnamed protein product [Rhodiola kirilowii]